MTLSERLFEANRDMQLIRQRAMTRNSKPEISRISLLEEHVEMIAKAIQALIEAKGL